MVRTPRQEIAALLRGGYATAAELARRIGAPLRRVVSDLEHVRRGVKPGEKWVVRPAECLTCGFIFRERGRINNPSRCPHCRSEQIREAAFEIREA